MLQLVEIHRLISKELGNTFELPVVDDVGLLFILELLSFPIEYPAVRVGLGSLLVDDGVTAVGGGDVSGRLR